MVGCWLKCGYGPYRWLKATGAFSFKVEGDANVLMGDASGLFAFYDNAAAVRERLKEAESTSMAG